MFKTLALCLLVVFAHGQVSNWNTWTSSKTNSVDVGIAGSTGNGVKVLLGAPGFIYSAAIPGLAKPTVASTALASANVVYVTVNGVTGTGAVVGVGIVRVPGASSGTCTATTWATEHTTSTLVGQATSATTCPSDFLTTYTGAVASSTSILETTPQRISVYSATNMRGYRFEISNPPQAAGSDCAQLVITPYTISATGAAATAGTPFTTINGGGTCGSGTDAKFTLALQNTNQVPTYGYYVELIGSGSTAAVCFQTQDQWTLAAGNCFASILSGVLASVGLVVAIFFN